MLKHSSVVYHSTLFCCYCLHCTMFDLFVGSSAMGSAAADAVD
jgi:hypothetical protein